MESLSIVFQFFNQYFLKAVILLSPFLFNFAVAGGKILNSDFKHMEIEGVYHAHGPVKVGTPDEEIVDFKITIIHSPRNNSLNLSIASDTTGAILFFASEVLYRREVDQIKIESFGINFRGIRQHMTFQVHPELGTINGQISANFLENTTQIEIKGERTQSLMELLAKGKRPKCGGIENYLGSYSGQFLESEAELHIHQVEMAQGTLALSGNLTGRIKLLYHDAYFSEDLGSITMINDMSYPMNGKSKKMILTCVENTDGIVLEGIHIASNGKIVDKIIFRQKN